jgi:ABC-2 type transport system ATP-binding protein/lipopolysaccharide transport system ATP-binding protein
LTDERVIVVDDRFIGKARHRIDNFVAMASILVLASHSAETCRQFCNKALWMDQGVIKAAGSLEEILEMYAETQRGGVEVA